MEQSTTLFQDESSSSEEEEKAQPIQEKNMKKKLKNQRKDQNYIRGLSRRLATAFEKTRSIQPNFTKKTELLEQIAFILILIRIIP